MSCFFDSYPAFSLFKEISLDSAVAMGGGISYNEDIMHSFQKFIVVTFCNHPPP